MNDIFNQFVKEQQALLDHKVRSAFEQHFGFPLDEVKDTKNLEHCLVEGITTEFFRYRGQTFLLYDRGAIKVNKEDGSYTATIEPKFLAV